MPIFRRFSTILLLLAAPAWADSITVSAAISLKEAVSQIAQNYESQTGNHVDLNFGASGQLAAQIAQGAPVDAFISAGTREMDDLARQNLIDPATRRVVCGNELVLVVPPNAAYLPGSFADLADGRIVQLAIGQPKTVPAGEYARQVLAHLKLTDVVAPKLVYGENVRQVLDYVERGEVDAGIVYATDAAEAGAKVKIAARADGSWHDPILYPAAVIRQSTKADAARRFLDFLAMPDSRKVFEAHGFVIPSPTVSATTAPAP
jgi:molybdate transport system substrate-binding protein